MVFMSKSDNELVTQHEQALENSQQPCPECGEKLTIKQGKSGTFLGCIAYPSCHFTRAVIEQNRIEDKVLVGSQCPECGHELAVKKGRYGVFIGCTNFPQCHHIEETHQQEQINIPCPACQNKAKGGQLVERTNRFGKTFFSCQNYPQCKYVVNYLPVNEKCPQCDWPILVKRSMSHGDVLLCPEKKCTYKRKAV
jgi:putative DNA topoisomerase